MSESLANEMYELSKEVKYTRFIDLLSDLVQHTSINTRQLDILIKIDFFSDFGNQRELLRITDLFLDTFNKGQAKQIKKASVAGTPLDAIIAKYSIGTTKSGGDAKSYTFVDLLSIMRESEDAIKALKMDDLSDTLKVRNFADVMGYIGYVSNKQSDRRKLYVLDISPLVRRDTGKQFGYNVVTKSIGSGKESRFTLVNRLYEKCPVQKGDIIYCESFERNGEYYRLTKYSKII